MAGLEKQTIAGFNTMIRKQKGLDGEAVISTVLFSDHFEVIHQRVPIKSVPLMTRETYYVQGTTALLDAIGRAIRKISYIHKTMAVSERPERTLFVVTTDGLENASIEFKKDDIKKMIDTKKEKNQWEFIFLGANIDAVSTARDFGIDENRVANYHADEKGTNLNYEVMSKTITSFRQNKYIDDDWQKDINSDFMKRKK